MITKLFASLHLWEKGSHSSHGDNRRNVQTARPCFYADFMKCQPLNFKGVEGVVGLTRWIEKMDMFSISVIRSLGPDGNMTYLGSTQEKDRTSIVRRGELSRQLEFSVEPKVRKNDVSSIYTVRFQELHPNMLKVCCHMKPKLVDKYISGGFLTHFGNVKLPDPSHWIEYWSWPTDLMDQEILPHLRGKAICKKRKACDSSKKKPWSPTTTFKRQNCRPKSTTWGTGEGKQPLWGDPLASQVQTSAISTTNGPVRTQRCHNVQKIRATFPRDCEILATKMLLTPRKGNGANSQRNWVVFECGDQDTSER
ncbi:hypothetical protein Tco_1400900 [Tanacetum coccineum]